MKTEGKRASFWRRELSFVQGDVTGGWDGGGARGTVRGVQGKSGVQIKAGVLPQREGHSAAGPESATV